MRHRKPEHDRTPDDFKAPDAESNLSRIKHAATQNDQLQRELDQLRRDTVQNNERLEAKKEEPAERLATVQQAPAPQTRRNKTQLELRRRRWTRNNKTWSASGIHRQRGSSRARAAAGCRYEGSSRGRKAAGCCHGGDCHGGSRGDEARCRHKQGTVRIHPTTDDA